MPIPQFNTIVEKLSTLRDLTAKSTGTVMDVEVDYGLVIDYINAQYDFLKEAFVDEIDVESTVTREEFVQVLVAALGKRIQWVRMKTNGVREGATIRVDNSLPLPGPVYELLYAFGRVDSTHTGIVFLPAFPEEIRVQVTVEALRRYLTLVTKLKHYYSFSESLPSQVDGSWAYLIYSQRIPMGSLTTAPTDEARPADAFLSAAVHCARVVAGIPYSVTYGTLPAPEVLRTRIFDAYAKGIGDGQ
jgi:hypothetical protein